MNDIAPTIDLAAQVYAHLMEEIKLRLASAAKHLAEVEKDPEARDAFLSAEHCYLQIRYICELTAMAALTANAADLEEPLPRKILQEWQPEQLFRQLESINKDCYPMPAETTQKEGHIHFERSNAPFLERSELPSVYGRCSDALHRGSVGQLLAEKRKAYDIGQLQSWNRAIWHLLNQHFVFLPHLSKVLLVTLGDRDSAAKVTICATPDGGEFVIAS